MKGSIGVMSSPRLPTSLIAIAVVCLSSVMPGAGHAQQGQSTVRFCFNSWPPYIQQDETGVSGISVDVLTEAARRADLTAVFEELPWNRCLEMVRQGTMDAVVDAAGREEFLHGPSSYSVYTNTIWVRDDDPLDSFSIDLLKGRRIGLVHGYEYPDALHSDMTNAGSTYEFSVDDAANVRMLAFGRVDAIIADLVSTLSFAREHGLSIHPLVPDHSVDRLYPSFNPDRADLHRALDAALADLIDDGTVDRAYRNHLGVGFEDVIRQ